MKNKDGAKAYFEKLSLVEKFCKGDTETAKKILKGEFNDIIVIKCRFKDEHDKNFGLFLIFISRIHQTIIKSLSVISTNASVYRVKPFDEWRTFYSKLEKEIDDADTEPENIEVLNAVLDRINELKFYKSIFRWIEDNDIQSLTEKFEKVIDKVLESKNSKATLDFEYLTSIELFEERGIKPI